MLQFTCKEEQTSEIIEWFVKEFSDLMKHTELKTLACDYFDEDLEDEIRGIISLIILAKNHMDMFRHSLKAI